MNELKNLTNVIGKLGKLVHKQKYSHDFFFYFINYNIIIVQVRHTLLLKQKKLPLLNIKGTFSAFVLGWGPSWSCGSWIYNYLCNQYLSPLKFEPRCVLDTTLCDEVCQWLAAGHWFSSSVLVSSINKILRHDITEILLKVALNTIMA